MSIQQLPKQRSFSYEKFKQDQTKQCSLNPDQKQLPHYQSFLETDEKLIIEATKIEIQNSNQSGNSPEKVSSNNQENASGSKKETKSMNIFENSKNDNNNIKVCVRLRPLNQNERSNSNKQKCVQILNEKTILWEKDKSDSKQFNFDFIGDETLTQQQIFDTIAKPIVDSCIQGYNGSIFAYGQTGAGKTYTIQGPKIDEEAKLLIKLENNGQIQNFDQKDTKSETQIGGGIKGKKNNKYRRQLSESDSAPLLTNIYKENGGIIQKSFDYIFEYIDAQQKVVQSSGEGLELSFLIKCSYVELYNEQIIDLLQPSSQSLNVREDLEKGVYIEGLKEEVILSYKDMINLIVKGAKNRHVGETAMNKQSSRSHSLLTAKIESKSLSKTGVWNIKTSRFHIIDLAGSERQKDTNACGQQLKEAGMINKSLSALGNVINFLAVSKNNRQFIPYRSSQLTFILRDSLGGNSKTVIIANVSPCGTNHAETLSTLEFAKRAKQIKNRAVVNEDSSGTILMLRQEIKKLKQDLTEKDKTYKFLLEEKSASIIVEDPQQEENEKKAQNNPICKVCKINNLLDQHDITQPQMNDSLLIDEEIQEKDNNNLVTPLKNRISQSSEGQSNFDISKEKRPQKRWANLAERAQQAEKLLEKNIEILQKSQEEHNNQIQTQQEKLKQAQTAISNLEQQAQREKMKLKLRENKIQKLETEHTLPTNEQIQGLKQEVELLKSQLKAEKDENSNPTIALLKVKITEYESQLKKTKEATGNSVIEQQVKEQTNMLHELKNYFQKQSMESIESKFTKYEKELKEYKEKLENQNADHKDLQIQYDILIKQNVEASETNQKLTRDAAKSLLELQDIRSKQRIFEDLSKDLQEQLSEAQNQLSEKDQKTKSLSEKDNILEKLQETLSDQVEDLKKKTKEQEKEIRDKIQIIDANKEEFKIKQTSIDQLKSILADKEQVLESRQTLSENLQQQIKELEEQNQKDQKNHKDEIQKVKASEQKIKEEIKNLKKKYNEQIIKLENDIEEQSNEIFNVKNLLDNETENSNKTQKANEQLQQKLDEVKQQLEASKKAFKDYQQANDNNSKILELETNLQKINSEKTNLQDEVKNLQKDNKSQKDEITKLISENEKAAGQQDDILLDQIQKLKEDIRQIENIHEVKLEEIYIKNTQRLSEEKSLLQETFNSKCDQLTIQIERLQGENEKLQGKIVVQDSKWKKNIPKVLEQQLNEKQNLIDQLQQDNNQLQLQKEDLKPLLEVIQQKFSQKFENLKEQIDQARLFLSCQNLSFQPQIIDITIIDQGQNKQNQDLTQKLETELIELKNQIKENSIQITNKDAEIKKIKEDQVANQEKSEQDKKDYQLKQKEYEDQISFLQDQLAIQKKEEENKNQLLKKSEDSLQKLKHLQDQISEAQKQSEDDKKQHFQKIKDYENQLQNLQKEKEQLVEQNQEKLIKINKLKQQKIDELDEQESKFQKQIFAMQCQLGEGQMQGGDLLRLQEICQQKIKKIQGRQIDLTKVNNKEDQKNNIDQYEQIVKQAKSQIKNNISLAIQELDFSGEESLIIKQVFQYINEILGTFVQLHEQQLLVQKKAAQVEFSRYKIKYELIKSDMQNFQKQLDNPKQQLQQPNVEQLIAKVQNLESINQKLLQDKQKQAQNSREPYHKPQSLIQDQIQVYEMRVQSQEQEIDIHQSRYKQLEAQKNDQLKKLEKRIQELIDEMNLINQNFSQAQKENKELNKQLEESKILLEKAEQHLTESTRKQQQLNKLAEARRLESDDLQKNLQAILQQYKIEKSRCEELEKANEQIQSGQRTQQSKINLHIKVKEENNMLREQNNRLQDDNFKKNSLLIQASDKTNEICASLQGINNMLLQKQNIMNAVQQSGFQFRLKDNEIAQLGMLGDLLEQIDLVISNLNHKISDSISERAGVVAAIPVSGIPPKPGNTSNIRTNPTMQKPMNLSMTYQNQLSGLKAKATTSHGILGLSGNKKKVEMSKSMLYDPRNKSKVNSLPRDSYQQLNNQKFIAQTLGSEFNSVKILASNTQASGTLIQRPLDFTGKKSSELLQTTINKVKISQLQYSPHENISVNSSNLSQKEEYKESAIPLVKTRQQYKQAQSQKKVGFRQGKELE